MRKKLFFGTIFFSFFFYQFASAISLYDKKDVSFNLKGSYKNLFFTSKRSLTNDPFIADLNRLRTEWDARFGKHFSTKLIWDNEIIAGDYVNSEEFTLRQVQRDLPYGNLDYELIHKKDFFYGQDFYRAYAKIDFDPMILVVGRQRIDWGVMHFFSPADLFSRLPIFDIESEERVGTTAANLSIQLPHHIKLNPVYVLDSDSKKMRAGARLTKTMGHFDVSGFGGHFSQDEIFGFDFSGDLGKAGLRGEMIYNFSELGPDFTQIAVGMTYGFENTFNVSFEYFYNGQGPATFVPGVGFGEQGNEIHSLKKHFLSLNLQYELTPLWKIRLFEVTDLTGGSFFISPETRYAAYDWLELTGGVLIPVGKTSGEFTAMPNTFYFQTQFFF